MPDQIHPFDLQARAALAARSLTALIDAQRDGLMYFLGTWRSHPPRAHHCLWDYGDGSGRHIDALTLMHAMSSAESNDAPTQQGEAQLEAWMLRMLGDDGLSWLPPEDLGKPWGIEQLLVDWQPGTPAAEISWAQRGTLMGLVSRYQATTDERYLTYACRMIDGLLAIAIRHPRGLYLPEGYYRPAGWSYDQPGFHAGIEEYNAAIVPPAIRLYEIAGYQPALELATGLVDFAVYYTPCYLPNGRFRPSEDMLESHFHTRSNFILGVLKLGLVAQRREYVSWARQSYDQARDWGTDFGWFPEGLPLRHGETCCTTDMLEIALLLGAHVDRRYYADAERYGRNHLLETQFLSRERLEEAVERLPPIDAGPLNPIDSTDQGVLETQVGAFAARSTLNDAFHLDATSMMQCCNAAGARALYDLWRYAVEDVQAEGTDEPHYAIHLRFSVVTPGLTVRSHEPAQGRLDIIARDACTLEVRLPQGTTQAMVVHMNAQGEQRVEVAMPQEGYIATRINAGQAIEVHYPLVERVASYEVGAGDHTLTCTGVWRGETLMQIEPRGHYYALYERSADLEPVDAAPPAGPLIDSI